jgi:hypothetical protein
MRWPYWVTVPRFSTAVGVVNAEAQQFLLVIGGTAQSSRLFSRAWSSSYGEERHVEERFIVLIRAEIVAGCTI